MTTQMINRSNESAPLIAEDEKSKFNSMTFSELHASKSSDTIFREIRDLIAILPFRDSVSTLLDYFSRRKKQFLLPYFEILALCREFLVDLSILPPSLTPTSSSPSSIGLEKLSGHSKKSIPLNDHPLSSLNSLFSILSKINAEVLALRRFEEGEEDILSSTTPTSLLSPESPLSAMSPLSYLDLSTSSIGIFSCDKKDKTNTYIVAKLCEKTRAGSIYCYSPSKFLFESDTDSNGPIRSQLHSFLLHPFAQAKQEFYESNISVDINTQEVMQHLCDMQDLSPDAVFFDLVKLTSNHFILFSNSSRKDAGQSLKLSGEIEECKRFLFDLTQMVTNQWLRVCDVVEKSAPEKKRIGERKLSSSFDVSYITPSPSSQSTFVAQKKDDWKSKIQTKRNEIIKECRGLHDKILRLLSTGKDLPSPPSIRIFFLDEQYTTFLVNDSSDEGRGSNTEGLKVFSKSFLTPELSQSIQLSPPVSSFTSPHKVLAPIHKAPHHTTSGKEDYKGKGEDITSEMSFEQLLSYCLYKGVGVSDNKNVSILSFRKTFTSEESLSLPSFGYIVIQGANILPLELASLEKTIMSQSHIEALYSQYTHLRVTYCQSILNVFAEEAGVLAKNIEEHPFCSGAFTNTKAGRGVSGSKSGREESADDETNENLKKTVWKFVLAILKTASRLSCHSYQRLMLYFGELESKELLVLFSKEEKGEGLSKLNLRTDLVGLAFERANMVIWHAKQDWKEGNIKGNGVLCNASTKNGEIESPAIYPEEGREKGELKGEKAEKRTDAFNVICLPLVSRDETVNIVVSLYNTIPGVDLGMRECFTLFSHIVKNMLSPKIISAIRLLVTNKKSEALSVPTRSPPLSLASLFTITPYSSPYTQDFTDKAVAISHSLTNSSACTALHEAFSLLSTHKSFKYTLEPTLVLLAQDLEEVHLHVVHHTLPLLTSPLTPPSSPPSSCTPYSPTFFLHQPTVSRIGINDFLSWSFDPFQHSKQELAIAVHDTLMHFSSVLAIPLSSSSVSLLLSAASTFYLDNHYHSFYHAINVLSAIALLYQQSNAKNILQPLDVLSILFAGLLHDIAHPGVNNEMFLKRKSRLSKVYPVAGVLENFHAALAMELLASFDVLEGFTPVDRQQFQKTLLSSILATDMSRHGAFTKDLNYHLEDISNGVSTPDTRDLVCQHLVKAGDLSNPVLPFHLCKEWSIRISFEFKTQYETESALHLPLSPLLNCDVSSIQSIATGQVSFYSYVVLPYWRVLAKALNNMDDRLRQLEYNLELWKEQSKEENDITHTFSPRPE